MVDIDECVVRLGILILNLLYIDPRIDTLFCQAGIDLLEQKLRVNS